MIRNMSNTLIDRINERLAITGKAVSAASLEATGARETLRKILDGTTKNPRIDTMKKIAAALGTTHAYLTGETDIPDIDAQHKPHARPDADKDGVFRGIAMQADVPILGTAAGSITRGAFQIEGGVIDYVPRPPAFMNARDIYALYVVGSSMEPQYFPGELIFINPHKPVKAGDIVVVQTQLGDHSTIEATLGIFLKNTEDATIIGKRHPNVDVQITRDTVKSIHRVLTVNEMFGA